MSNQELREAELDEMIDAVLLATPCIICKEDALLTKEQKIRIKYNIPLGPIVCDNCRKAILEMRRQIGC